MLADAGANLADSTCCSGGENSCGECDCDPWGVCDFMKWHWKWFLGACWILGLFLLFFGIGGYLSDYAPYKLLVGFEVTKMWVEGPRINCPYNGRMIDCYDGYVMGNYTWVNSPQFCKMKIVEDGFQSAEVESDLQKQFPHLGEYSMWSASPDTNNKCVRSINAHWGLIISGIIFTSISCITTIIIIAQCILTLRKKHRKNIHQLHLRPPSLRLNSSQLTLGRSGAAAE